MNLPQPTRRLAHAAQLAGAGHLDADAPTRGEATVTTSASPEAVWATLCDILRWPEVLPGVSRVALESGSPLQPGAAFSWRNKGIPLRSTVRRMIDGAELTWTGTAFWLVAIHRNVIEPMPGGGSRLTAGESMSGAMASLLMPSRTLDAQLEGFARAVVSDAERRHR